MANNFVVRDGNGVAVTFVSTDIGGGVQLMNNRITDGTNFMPTLDTAGRAGFVKLTDGTNQMPMGDAVARALFIKLTDGTNMANTMDAAARAGFVKLTDGTNTAPTMDAPQRQGYFRHTDGTNLTPAMDNVARAAFFKLTDGANTAPTMDAAARAAFFKLTDGTNTAPTMDAVGRAGYQRITDGTNVASVVQLHLQDNLALTSSNFSLSAAGLSGIMNINNKFDIGRGVLGDNAALTGYPVDVSCLVNVGVPVNCTNTVTAGASKTLNIASTANIFAPTGNIGGSIVMIDDGTSQEFAHVNAVVANTSITVDNLSNGHTAPFNVYPLTASMPRDAAAEGQFSDTLVGANLAIDYTSDGTNLHVERNVMGLNLYSDFCQTNLVAGNLVAIVLQNTPPSVAVNTPVLVDTGTSVQEIAKIVAINTGTKTVTVKKLANNHNGTVAPVQIQFPYQGLNQAPVNFGGFGITAEAAVIASGKNLVTGMQQYTVEKDVNAAGQYPVFNTASSAGMDADVDYFLRADNVLQPLIGDNNAGVFVQDYQTRQVLEELLYEIKEIRLMQCQAFTQDYRPPLANPSYGLAS